MKIFYHLSGKDSQSIIFYTVKGFSGPFATLLYRLKISANSVTIFRCLLVVYALYCFYTGEYSYYIQGAIILVLNLFLDFVDGDLARLHKNETELGEWLEIVNDNLLSQAHSLIGFTMAYGIYKQTEMVAVWYVVFLIAYAVIVNNVLSKFSIHPSDIVDTMKSGFQSEYNKIMKKSFFSKLYFTSMHWDCFLILIAVILYNPIYSLTGLHPLFLVLAFICIVSQVRWLSKFVLQIKYFLTK